MGRLRCRAAARNGGGRLRLWVVRPVPSGHAAKRLRLRAHPLPARGRQYAATDDTDRRRGHRGPGLDFARLAGIALGGERHCRRARPGRDPIPVRSPWPRNARLNRSRRRGRRDGRDCDRSRHSGSVRLLSGAAATRPTRCQNAAGAGRRRTRMAHFRRDRCALRQIGLDLRQSFGRSGRGHDTNGGLALRRPRSMGDIGGHGMASKLSRGAGHRKSHAGDPRRRLRHPRRARRAGGRPRRNLCNLRFAGPDCNRDVADQARSRSCLRSAESRGLADP